MRLEAWRAVDRLSDLGPDFPLETPDLNFESVAQAWGILLPKGGPLQHLVDAG